MDAAAMQSQAAWQPTATQMGPEQVLAIRFTGSGSEYFRIWIVNLLLTLVTLGLYFPWAKVRKLRYFYANTLVGEHPLGFHADPKKMLRGYLLVTLLLVLYSAAGKFSPAAGLVALLLVAALWPALIKSSFQFRLANTSWRGLRMRFRGSLGGAYKAMLPLWIPAIALVGFVAAAPEGRQPPAWFPIAFVVLILASFAAMPMFWWMLKKYQHDSYAYGNEQTALDCGPGGVYGVFFKTMGVSFAAFMALGVLVGVGSMLFVGAAALTGGADGAGMKAAIAIGLAVAVLLMVFAQVLPRPYFVSRMQNLLWSRTASRAVAFRSRLGFRPLLVMTLKNWLLMVLTLGLYWPFAAIAMYRLRVQAVTLTMQIDPELIVDTARAQEGEAAGDAAGDLFGIDIGL